MNAYLSEPNYLESNLKYSGQQKEQVEQLVSYLATNKPLTFEECIIWARLQFEDKYNNAIRQLLFSLPKDAVTSSGQPFWSGPKRAPDALTFNSNEVSLCTVYRGHGVDIILLANPSAIHHRSRKLARVQLWLARGDRSSSLQEDRGQRSCSRVYPEERCEGSSE